MWSKGGVRKTRRVRRSRQPQQFSRKKKKKVCVLDKGGGHPARASELNLGQFGVRGGASRVRVFPIYPYLTTKADGLPPFDHFPKVKQHWQSSKSTNWGCISGSPAKKTPPA